jgi:hypothetical protein
MFIYQGLEQPRICSLESHDGLLQIADHNELLDVGLVWLSFFSPF